MRRPPSPSHSAPKRPRLDRDPSASPPSQHSSSARTPKRSDRTGQACEACQARKIKCDDSLGGCAPCRKKGLKCIQRDRTTHATVARGYAQHLEARLAHTRACLDDSRHHVERLTKLMTAPGPGDGDVVPPAHPSAPGPGASFCSSPALASSSPSPKSAVPDTPASDDAPDLSPAGLPYPKSQSPPEWPSFSAKHMGVPSREGALDMYGRIGRMTGYHISFFGLTVNVLNYVSDETWKRDEEMSWKFFLHHLHQKPFTKGTLPPPHATLPHSRDECRVLAEKYIAFVNVWLPVIPRTQLDALIDKIYRAGPPQTADLEPAEVCRIHMVLALVKYQDWSRNKDASDALSEHSEGLRTQSFAHYIFTIRHFGNLMQKHGLETLQVAVLVAGFLRQFPHPGAVWMMTHWSMALAIDLGLHRSYEGLEPVDRASVKAADIELRKRIFWSIFSMRILSCGSLGRPIELRHEDFDIEIPEAENDTPPEASFRIPDQRCSFRAGIEVMKLTELYLIAYNDIYPIRPIADYAERVKHIETRQAEWRRNLPMSLQVRDPRTASYARHDRGNEFDYFAEVLSNLDGRLALTLHHPAICRDENAHLRAESAGKNIHACVQILGSAYRLKGMRALDTTWASMSSWVAAILTLLWVHWAAKAQLTRKNVAMLYQTLVMGLGMLDSAGRSLGSNKQLLASMYEFIEKFHEAAGLPIVRWHRTLRRSTEPQTSAGSQSTSAGRVPTPLRRASDASTAPDGSSHEVRPEIGLAPVGVDDCDRSSALEEEGLSREAAMTGQQLEDMFGPQAQMTIRQPGTAFEIFAKRLKFKTQHECRSAMAQALPVNLHSTRPYTDEPWPTSAGFDSAHHVPRASPLLTTKRFV